MEPWIKKRWFWGSGFWNPAYDIRSMSDMGLYSRYLDKQQYSHDGRGKPIDNAYQRNNSVSRNPHPTVKPTDLMQYLCRLITPAGGTVLDPYMGSGSTGKAAMKEGFSFVGCELDPEYYEIAKTRINNEIK